MTTYRATLALEVTDPSLLTAYTSGFMPKTSTTLERLAALLQGPIHHLDPELNGVTLVGVLVEEP
jgi:hypothetical protein